MEADALGVGGTVTTGRVGAVVGVADAVVGAGGCGSAVVVTTGSWGAAGGAGSGWQASSVTAATAMLVHRPPALTSARPAREVRQNGHEDSPTRM